MINKNDIRYSVILCYYEDFYKDEYKNIIIKIEELIKMGKKIIVFAIDSVYINLKEIENKYSKYKAFKSIEVHKLTSIPKDLKYRCIEFKENDCLGGVISTDGENKNQVEYINGICKTFNLEQYKIEHCNEDFNIKVEAGAGTGKTTTMVNRIMYLIHMNKYLNLENIHMITFTNKAKNEMKEKIEQNLLERIEITKDIFYIKHLEQIGNMHIATIDSYFKNVANEIGIPIGHHNNLTMRSFKKDKKEIIRQALDNIKYSEDMLKVTKLYEFENLIYEFWNKFYTLGITDKEIKNLNWGTSHTPEGEKINYILNEIFNVITEEFINLMEEEKSIELRNIMLNIESAIEKNISIDKDLLKQKLSYPEYIFVDEFQDTSKSQIKVIAWLCDKLDSKVFVVGDQKQAIYRFRGANDSAFMQLEEHYSSYSKKITEFKLKINYRTQKDTLERIQNIIEPWVNKKGFDKNYRLISGNNCCGGEFNIINIPIGKKDELIILNELNNNLKMIDLSESVNGIIGKYVENDFKSIEFYREELLNGISEFLSNKEDYKAKGKKISEEVMKSIKVKYIEDILDIDIEDIVHILKEITDEVKKYKQEKNIKESTINFLKSNKDRNITILVRDNIQVNNIKRLCSKNGIPCSVDIKGNFYGSKAVRDYYILVRSFLYNNLKSKISLIDTPYIYKQGNKINELIKNTSNLDDIGKEVDSILFENNYFKNRDLIKIYNFLNLSDKIIKEQLVIHNFYKETISEIELNNSTYSIKEIKEHAETEAKRYERNLSKLIEMLNWKLGEEASLVDIHNYLENKIATDREEEEVEIDEINSKVICMTVHKSKGLQFENVLIPFMNKPYINENRNNILIEYDKQNNQYKVGWNISIEKYNENKGKKEQIGHCNDLYSELFINEKKLIEKDEMNLLYVAFTRTKNNLTIIKPEKCEENTWGELL